MELKQTPSLAAAIKITEVKRKNTKQQSKHGPQQKLEMESGAIEE